MPSRLRHLTFALASALLATSSAADEPIVGGPCEGCENVFVGMPAELAATSRIAAADEPGEPMVIDGTVRNLDGTPAAGIIVYAYQTNAGGRYPEAETRHGALRGWAQSDEDGGYRFETIRPGAYPSRSIPQHVHMHVIEPGHVSYTIDDILFDDDPLLTQSQRRNMLRGRGGNGLAQPTRDAEGVWHVRRDITLGEGIPGYPCRRRWTFPVPFYQSLSWSPDGRRIAYSAVTSSWDEGYSIFIANADGSDARLLPTGGERDLYPVWSPDGSRIAFQSSREGNTDIYLLEVEGGEARRLTDDEANDGYPTWSPDGVQIAFHSNREGDYDIYVMNADGSHTRQITDDPGDDYNPSWSPSGDWIAFDADRDRSGADEIHLVSPDGERARRLTPDGVFPNWSPDGRRLLFTSEALHRIDVDGGNRVELMDQAVYAAWSPTEERIAVAAVEFDDLCRDRHRLISLRPDGSDPVVLGAAE